MVAPKITMPNAAGSNSSNQTFIQHPDIAEYYLHLEPFITCSCLFSILLLLLNFAIFCTTAAQLKTRLNKPLRRPSTFLCSIYPLISLAAVITILIPKSVLICHTFMHLSFTVAALVFRDLCFRYVGSEHHFLKERSSDLVTISTPPCFCCCTCLPMLKPSRTNLCIFRYMVWQMPFVQGSIMLVLNVVYYREPAIYSDVRQFFIPFIVGSIIMGVWGLNITTRMIAKVHTEYALLKKMFSVQLILLVCKLQYLILDSFLDGFEMGPDYPMNHTIYKQSFINLLILSEMVLVSLFAQHAYKVPIEL